MIEHMYKEGELIGELVFIVRVRRIPRNPEAKFKCRCGNEFICKISAAKRLKTRSCGCIRYKLAAVKRTIHSPVETLSKGVKRMPVFREEDYTRFWQKVDVLKDQGECWNWQAGNNKRYGLFNIGSGYYKSNRVAYFLHFKIDPEGQSVLHSCHNSMCCNPNHLSLGSHVDNMSDMVSAGRQHKGAQINTAKVSEMEVIEIKKMLKEGYRNSFLMKKFNVSSAIICNIKKGVTWKHI